MRTLLDRLAALVAVVAQQSQATAIANARSAATEAWTRRLEREEVEAYLSPTTVVSTGLASVVH